MRLVAEGLDFPEGPIALKDGTLLVAEIRSGMLARVDTANGAIERVANLGGGPNGAAIGPDGAVYVCNNGGVEWVERNGIVRSAGPSADYARGSIQRVDPQSGAVTLLYDRCNGETLSAPNDIVFDAAGGFWFTDLGKDRARSRDHGGVYYAQPDGSHIEAALYPLNTPNGIALSPDGGELYVAETATGRIWAWPLVSPGMIGRAGPGPHGARLVYGFEGFQLLDSMAIDSAGNLCVATLMTGAISVLDPGGKLLEQIAVPGNDPIVTNICFGGIDLRTAYVASSGRGRIYAMDWPCPGLALAFAV